MKPLFSRTAGTALVGAAILGILFSLGGLILLGVYSTRITASLVDTLGELSDALVVTGNGLEIAGSALDEADTALGALAVTMEGVNTTLVESQPSLTTISTLLGTELPNTIIATQGSLESAETSAKNIDGLLSSLSRLPFLGSLVYNPEVPLNETLAGVSDSLDEIPTSLRNAQKSLDLALEGFDSVNTELSNITESTDQIRASTGEAIVVIEDYQEMVEDLQKDVERLQTDLPRKMRWVMLAAALFLVWLGLAQIGLLTQGLELIKRSKPPQPDDEKPHPVEKSNPTD